MSGEAPYPRVVLQIRKVREAKNMSQERLAMASGVSLRTIARVEATGRANSSTVTKIARALGVSVAELYDKGSAA